MPFRKSGAAFARSGGMSLALIVLALGLFSASIGDADAASPVRFNGDWGVQFREQLFEQQSELVARGMLEEFVRLSLRGPLGLGQVGSFGLQVFLFNGNVFPSAGQRGFGTAAVGLAGNLGFFESRRVAFGFDGSVRVRSPYGRGVQSSASLGLDGGAHLRLRPGQGAPDIGLQATISDQFGFGSLKTHSRVSTLALSLIQDAGGLTGRFSYLRSAANDLIGGGATGNDMLSLGGTMNLGPTLSVRVAARTQSSYHRFPGEDPLQMGTSGAEIVARYAPSKTVTSQTYYRYRRQMAGEDALAYHSLGEQIRVILAPGLTLNADLLVDGDRKTIGTDPVARTASVQQQVSLFATRAGKRGSVGVAGRGGFGFSGPTGEQGGGVGQLGAMAFVTAKPVRAITFQANVGATRVEDSSSLNQEMSSLGLAAAAMVNGGQAVTASLSYGFDHSQGSTRASATDGHRLGGGLSLTTPVKLNLSYGAEGSSQDSIIGKSLGFLHQGQVSWGLGRFLSVEGRLLHGAFQTDDGPVIHRVEAIVGMQLDFTRFTIGVHVSSNYPLMEPGTSQHLIWAQVSGPLMGR